MEMGEIGRKRVRETENENGEVEGWVGGKSHPATKAGGVRTRHSDNAREVSCLHGDVLALLGYRSWKSQSRCLSSHTRHSVV